MSKPFSAIFIAILFLSVCGIALASEQDAREDVGAVERVKKRADALFDGKERRLQSASSIYYLDLLRTAEGARLEVELKDGSEITMGENAELVVDKFVYEPEGSQQIILNAVKGALLFVSDKLRKSQERSVLVRTPVALLGARGTRFWVGPIDGATGVLVLEGEVRVSSQKGRVVLEPGEGTMVKEDGSLSPRKVWGEAKVARALNAVAF